MGDGVRQQGEYDGHGPGASPSARPSRLTWGLRGLGLAAALLVWLAMGRAEGVSSDARLVAAIATLMAIWWMTEAIPLPLQRYCRSSSSRC